MSVELKCMLKEGASVPSYQSSESAGCDVRAFLSEDLVIRSGEAKLVPTGLYLEIPEGYEIQVRPRSGLALRNSVTVLNSPGTIDSDYRGEIGIILINHSDRDFCVRNGDRIAQLVLSRVEKARFTVADSLAESGRGSGGFGSTGV